MQTSVPHKQAFEAPALERVTAEVSAGPSAGPSVVPTTRIGRRYGATILLGAFLLFQVQPQIARAILPWFGGGAAVWSACMLFFQVQLLVGYAYAHFLARSVSPRTQAVVHVSLLAVSLLFLPAIPDASWRPTGAEAPTLHIYLVLLATVGLPYSLLAATGPLLQSWFAREYVGRSPYRLFSLSNFGSLAALLSFPVLFEPFFTIGVQARTWAIAYVAFCLLSATCARSASRRREWLERSSTPKTKETVLSVRQIASWIALAAVPSVMLLAVTNRLSIDVAVTPFFWVVPLALYLASFILTFDSSRWYRPVPMGVALIALAVFLLFVGDSHWWDWTIAVQAFAFCTCLFLSGLVCHGELARQKPAPRHLTSFYLLVSLGGALGGTFVAVLAPRVFDSYLEVPLALLACALVGAVACDRAIVAKGKLRRLFRWSLILAPALGLVGALSNGMRNESDYLERSRSFFGLISVRRSIRVDLTGAGGAPRLRERIGLRHGSTVHGEQVVGEAGNPLEGLSYYSDKSGAGYVLGSRPGAKQAGWRIGVIGLGTGTIAHYAGAEDRLTFYEIDSEILRVAEEHFTYTRDARTRGANVDFRLGDARIQLERQLETDGALGFDLLVLDAFSSDAIPVHLLTREAHQAYWRHLSASGILLVHISNRHLDLLPVVVGLAEEAGKEVRVIDSEADETVTKTGSTWVVVCDDADALEQMQLDGMGTAPELDRPAVHWTDDFSSLWHVLR